MTDLGSVGGDPCSRALSINARGQIVGFTAAVCGGDPTHGFLWENDGPAIDLNTLVPPGSGLALRQPTYINDRGEIAGFGSLSNGDTHAFVLIPCGEGDADCRDGLVGGSAAATPQGEATQREKLGLPEDVRKMVRDRLGLRSGITLRSGD